MLFDPHRKLDGKSIQRQLHYLNIEAVELAQQGKAAGLQAGANHHKSHKGGGGGGGAAAATATSAAAASKGASRRKGGSISEMMSREAPNLMLYERNGSSVGKKKSVRF
jgi:hypothetical protein